MNIKTSKLTAVVISNASYYIILIEINEVIELNKRFSTP